MDINQIQDKDNLRLHFKESFPTPLFKLSSENTRLLYTRWKNYNVEEWYSSIKEYTFKSEIFPISIDIARILLKSSQILLKISSEFEKDNERSIKMFNYLSNNIEKQDFILLNKFKDNLDLFIKEKHFHKDNGFFIRLSTLSPKDTILDDIIYLKPFIINEMKYINDINNIYLQEQCIAKAIGKALKVYNASDIIYLLLRSNRVRSDLKWMLSYEDTFWENNIIIREWVDIPLSMEFRGICIERRLTALSQYAHDIYFEELNQSNNTPGEIPIDITTKIYNFWDTVKDIIPYNTCIVDFAVLSSKILIIELNPLDIYSGALLFNWNTDTDILIDGDNTKKYGITTRIRTKDTHQEIILASWMDIIQECKNYIENEIQEEEQIIKKPKWKFW